MAFKYALSAEQQTPTSDSKVVLCKSFKIDIAGGSGFTTATTYDLGWFPKDAQMIQYHSSVSTAVSGGTVSAATIALTLNGLALASAINVYATGSLSGAASATYMAGAAPTTDQKLTYTPTLTGSGATAGIIYLSIFYVV